MVAFSVVARILWVFSVSVGPLVIGLSQTILFEEKFNDTNVKHSITCMLKIVRTSLQPKAKCFGLTVFKIMFKSIYG